MKPTKNYHFAKKHKIYILNFKEANKACVYELIEQVTKKGSYDHFFTTKNSQEKNVACLLTTQLRLGFVKVWNKSNL